MRSPEPEPLAPAQRELLLDLARASIRSGLARAVPQAVELDALPPELAAPRASFVTLTLQGRLRGCMGRLRAVRPLAEDVAGNAFAAAFLDPRFPPVAAGEVPDLAIEVSLLTPPEPIRFRSEADLIRRLVPGRDGLILARGCRQATFLPDMWDQLPAPEAFVEQLLRKAGLARGEPGLEAWRYRTERIQAAQRQPAILAPSQ